MRFHHRLTDGPPTRGRRILVWGLVALAMILVLAGSLTIWVQRQALDTDNWVDLSTELLARRRGARPGGGRAWSIRSSPSTTSSRAIADRLPPPLDGLAAPVAGWCATAAVARRREPAPAPARPAALGGREPRRPLPARRHPGGERGPGRRDRPSGRGRARPGRARQAARPAARPERAAPQPDAGSLRDRRLRPARGRPGRRVGSSTRCPSSSHRRPRAARRSPSTSPRASGARRLRGIGVGLILIGLLLLVVRAPRGRRADRRRSPRPAPSRRHAVWAIGTDLLRNICLGLIAYGIVLWLGALLAGPTRPARWIRQHRAPRCATGPWSPTARSP